MTSNSPTLALKRFPKDSVTIEIPDEVIRDILRADALLNCRVPFKSIQDREGQMIEVGLIREHVADIVLSILLRKLRRS